jgi:hypothetical protein
VLPILLWRFNFFSKNFMTRVVNLSMLDTARAGAKLYRLSGEVNSYSRLHRLFGTEMQKRQ